MKALHSLLIVCCMSTAAFAAETRISTAPTQTPLKVNAKASSIVSCTGKSGRVYKTAALASAAKEALTCSSGSQPVVNGLFCDETTTVTRTGGCAGGEGTITTVTVTQSNCWIGSPVSHTSTSCQM